MLVTFEDDTTKEMPITAITVTGFRAKTILLDATDGAALIRLADQPLDVIRPMLAQLGGRLYRPTQK